ncbi:MAG TPA: hypothetical protein VK655_08505 [Solirubrobacteraceae bacterium]|jgi:hypothetical protein|nr:hypothetical protein [Solirubrobacteraceae bacterium]
MSADPTRSAVEGDVAQDAEPPLERLRGLLLEEGGLMGSLIRAEGLADQPVDGPAQVVAAGPRAEGSGAEYELLVETIYEGYLLHYHAPRVVCARDADLDLLAGDRLYALGLARLVRLGDIEGVAELADVITLCALAHGGGAPELAAGIWMAGARAVGWGASPEHEQAKALVRAGSPDALAALRALVVSS